VGHCGKVGPRLKAWLIKFEIELRTVQNKIPLLTYKVEPYPEEHLPSMGVTIARNAVRMETTTGICNGKVIDSSI
jgi:hypothetical protein